jgi:hypothetical protein
MEEFNYMIDLFTCLNLNIKGKSYMELEDFLYFFDNFSFLFKEPIKFKNFVQNFC